MTSGPASNSSSSSSSGQRSVEEDQSRAQSRDVRDRQDGLLPVVKFLQSALAMKARGDGLHYQHLVAQLLTRDDPETLWRLYLGLAQCVTVISQQPDEFKELIDAVFRFDWRGKGNVVEAFGSLLSHLISANGTCMMPAMHMLVRNLVLDSHDVDGEGNVDPAALTRQHTVHEALQASLTLVPSGRSKLYGVLRQNYPHRRLRAEILSDYALQALRVVQYAPLIEESVVRLIITRSLEIDVEIKIMDTGEAVVDDEDEESDALFTMDDIESGAADTSKSSNKEEVDEMAEKLDGVMLVVFSYLDQRLTANSSLPPGAILETPPAGVLETVHSCTSTPTGGDSGRGGGGGEWADGGVAKLSPGFEDSQTRNQGGGQGMEPVARLLQSLLVVFEENVLPTHRSKFVQFVLFFACGKAAGLEQALIAKLLGVLRDETRPKLTRQSSVAYLASFLARGSFISAPLLSKAVGALLEWAGSYLDRQQQEAEAVTTAMATETTTRMMMAPNTPMAARNTPGSSKAFQTPVTNRLRARPQSWHGTKQQQQSPNTTTLLPMPATSVKSSGGRGRGGGGMMEVAGSVAAADHMLFYSVCQATFYVMCFRGDELAGATATAAAASVAAAAGGGGGNGSGGGGDFERQAAVWQRLLTCSLLPLRHCLDTVRREFARLCCGLMEDFLDSDLLDHLASIAEERTQVPSQTITVGSSFSCSTPHRASMSFSSASPSFSVSSGSGGMWTPSRRATVTKAGGLGRGSNPLDSFFPFDPYLLRRSHVFVEGMYNTWKAQDDNPSSHQQRRRNRRTPGGTSAATTRLKKNGLGQESSKFSEGGSSSSSFSPSHSGSSDSDSDSDFDSEQDTAVGGGGSGVGVVGVDDMDLGSLSFRDGASGGGIHEQLRRQHKKTEKKKMKKKKMKKERGSGANNGKNRKKRENHSGGNSGDEENSSSCSSCSSSCSSSDEDGDSTGGVSKKMAGAYITESMSVTPASSVAVGSLMGRSLGNTAISSSFADDGLMWGGGGELQEGCSVDDAFFHEDVSPAASPPLADSGSISGSGTVSGGTVSGGVNFGRTSPVGFGGDHSRRALF